MKLGEKLHRDIVTLGFAVEYEGKTFTNYLHTDGKIMVIFDKEMDKYYFFYDDQPYYFGKVNNREELVRIVNSMKEL